MKKKIGIRREDKNRWERRTPLVPAHVRELKNQFGIETTVQPSTLRIFSDEEYRNAGAEIKESLDDADVVFAVKEIPGDLFVEGKTYVFFSHTIKGQPYNMDLLKKMVDKKINLIDYEKITDENNRRLIFFGRYAGLAGMVETLHALGQKLKLQGFDTPLERIKQPYQYESVENAKKAIEEVGEEITENGFPVELSPFVFGFTGYGNVSRGAQEMFDVLPHKVVSINILSENYENFVADNYHFYKVVFKEEDIVKPKNGVFELQDYYKNPHKYVSVFDDYIPSLKVLMNCIYWTEDYPRLVTKEFLQSQAALRSYLNLRVIGDISCDINGSIEITEKTTMPDIPTFTYFPNEDIIEDGVKRGGVTVMAVDNLPCEFPSESSEEFSKVLKNFATAIAQADFSVDFSKLKLPDPIKRGLILHNGRFTENFKYMEKFI